MRFALLMVVVIVALGSAGRYLFEGMLHSKQKPLGMQTDYEFSTGYDGAAQETQKYTVRSRGSSEPAAAGNSPSVVQSNPFSD